MKAFNHFIICFIIVLVSFFLPFYFVFNDSFASSITLPITLDSQSASLLETGAYQDLGEASFNLSPEMVIFGLDQVYNDINYKLYDKYGWDLETASWEVEDALASSVHDQVVSKLALGATVGQTAKLIGTTAWNTTWGKLFALADVNEESGVASVLSDNLYVEVTDNLISTYSALKTDLIDDQVLYDFSQANHFLYGSAFHFIYNNINYTLNFNEDVCLFSLQSQIHIASEYSYGHSFSGSGVMVVNGNPTVLTGFSSDTSQIDGTFTVGSKTYYSSALLCTYQTGSSGYVYSSTQYGNYQSVQDFLVNTSDGFASSYYRVGYQSLADILADLKGHFVTTDDLRRLEDLILDLPITTDGTTAVIDGTDTAVLARIEALVQELVDEAALVDEGLGEWDPEPEPPKVDVDFPIAYWPSFFPELLPEGMFSMFQPIFDIVGSTYSMYGLWILIPSILIFILILYILISLF